MHDLRPDVLGTTTVFFADGEFAEIVYFSSEDEARRAETQEVPDRAASMLADLQQAMPVERYIDLTQPKLMRLEDRRALPGRGAPIPSFRVRQLVAQQPPTDTKWAGKVGRLRRPRGEYLVEALMQAPGQLVVGDRADVGVDADVTGAGIRHQRDVGRRPSVGPNG